MATWTTASELSGRYLVGPERLLDYSRRGNLPMLRGTDGVPLFDEQVVARLFPARQQRLAPSGANLGVLGSSRLGPANPPEISEREARRREIWRNRRDSATEQFEMPRSRVG